jgi:hypothetical protein
MLSALARPPSRRGATGKRFNYGWGFERCFQSNAPTVAPAALDGPFSGSFRGSGSDETNLLATKPFLAERRRRLETMLGYVRAIVIQRRGSIMPSIFDLLYREYCRARLTEMRKQLLIRPESHEVPEANFDVDRPDCAADRGGNRLRAAPVTGRGMAGQ